MIDLYELIVWYKTQLLNRLEPCSKFVRRLLGKSRSVIHLFIMQVGLQLAVMLSSSRSIVLCWGEWEQG